MSITDRLIERAKRTPYYHLPGYMNRYWLVPPARVLTRPGHTSANGWAFVHTDNSGPVSWRRPIARVLQLMGISIRVHEILRSDIERHPHNHPWAYCTILLRGAYDEWRYDDRGFCKSVKRHTAPAILFRGADNFHRLSIDEGKTVATLFIAGRKSQSWGFKLRGGEFVPWRKYLGEDK